MTKLAYYFLLIIILMSFYPEIDAYADKTPWLKESPLYASALQLLGFERPEGSCISNCSNNEDVSAISIIPQNE